MYLQIFFKYKKTIYMGPLKGRGAAHNAPGPVTATQRQVGRPSGLHVAPYGGLQVSQGGEKRVIRVVNVQNIIMNEQMNESLRCNIHRYIDNHHDHIHRVINPLNENDLVPGVMY